MIGCFSRVRHAEIVKENGLVAIQHPQPLRNVPLYRFLSAMSFPGLLLLTNLVVGRWAAAQGSGNPPAPLNPTPRDAQFTSFDGTKIHYETAGEGEPVVLVHGFISHGGFWKQTPLYQELLKNGFRVINLDLRGNGKSDHPHQLTAYQNDAEARDVMALAKFLKLDNYAVVGYSRGAIIASRLLVLDKSVRTAVLGGMGADFTNPQWPRREAFYRAFLNASLGGGAVPEAARGAVEYARTSGADLVALAQMQGAQPTTSPEELGDLHQPVLVIAGDQDSDNGSAAELAGLLGNATYESVPGGVHNNTARLPAFSTAIVRFLKK